VLGRDDNGNEIHGERRFIPDWYMSEHVDLAYASTVHAAQGRTVDNLHVVVDEMTDRVAFYVAMSRGRRENRAYVVTKQVDKDTREHHLDRLASLVSGEADRLSATQFLEREQARAEHLGNLGARWTILVTDHRNASYDRLFAAAMDARTFKRYERDPATATLHRLIATMELRGADPAQLINRIVSSRELRSADSVSQVLITRALQWVRSGGRGPICGDDYAVIDDHALHTESYVAHAAEQMALNTGEDSVRPGCVHEALEWVLGRGEAPVED
jgi:hypothetical protein